MSGEGLKNYNINTYSFSFAGIPLEGGFAEDSVVKVTPMSPAYVSKVGADASVVRGRVNDPRVSISFYFLRSSDINAKLSALHNLDLLDPSGGAGVGVFALKDNNGTTVMLCAQAWITVAPDIDLAKELKEVEWKFEAIVTARLDGGN